MKEGMDNQNPIVYFDLKIEDEKVGRVIIELYKNIVPKTVENFLALCVGDRGNGSSGRPLHYKGTIFHKVVKGVFVQGGDVTNLDGSGGESIYGPSFNAENFILKHDKPGTLSTVNSGENFNTSQFIITTSECPHLDGSSVVFGRVVKGLSCVIQVSEVETKDDYPFSKCSIENCGQINPGEPWNYIDCDETDDNYPPDPRDLEIPVEKVEVSDMIEIVLKIKQSGNYFFSKKNYIEADRKYRKAVRYIDWFTPVFLKTGNDHAILEISKLEREKFSCMLNSSATAIKKGLYRESLNLCDEVLAKEKDNPKAYFRRGKARMCLNDYEGALIDQKKALTLVPNDKCVIQEINQIHRAIKKYLVQEKKVFSKMFHPFK